MISYYKCNEEAMERLGPFSFGVAVGVDVLKTLFHDLCVHLGRGDVGVTHHLLNYLELRAIFQQQSGKGMAQGMGSNVLIDTSLFGVLLDDFPKALTGQARAIHIG